MSLSEKEVRHIANLARIGIDKEEIAKYQKDLSAVLDYFQKMEELETQEIEPITYITRMDNVLRKDAETDFGSLGKNAIKKNFPEEKNGSVKVKSVL